MLSIDGVSKSFGALQALKRVSFRIDRGTIHGIIGPNGSGKTTLFNCITGLLRPEAGAIRLEGEELVGLKPHLIANRGIRRTFQSGRLVGGLTVLENVMVGLYDFRGRDFVGTFLRPPFRPDRREEEVRGRAVAALRVVGLEKDQDRWAGDLVWAERQFVQIARALVSRPKMVLLDEPNSGMGAGETERVEEVIRRVRETGTTVVVISHDVKMLMGLCGWVTVLSFGERIAGGRPEQVQQDPRVLEAYLGVE